MAATQTAARILTAEGILRKGQISEGTLIGSFFLRFYRKEQREGGGGRSVQSLIPSFPRGNQARLRAGRRLSVRSTIGVAFGCCL